MNILRILIIVILSIFLLFGCAYRNLSLEGVVNNQDGKPIEDVKVSTGNLQTFTDSMGRLFLEGKVVGEGIIYLYLEKSGYTPVKYKVKLSYDENHVLGPEEDIIISMVTNTNS